MAEEIEKKKRTILDVIREIIELFRKPYYVAAMKALEENLNTMGYNNAATAAVLDNLVSVTSEIKGKLTGDMSEEKAQELMRELQEKIEAISGELADMKKISEVLSSDGVNGATYSLYEKDGDLYLSQSENDLIGKKAHLVDFVTSPEGVKTAFTCKEIDVDPLESIKFTKVELEEDEVTHSEAIANYITHHYLSDDEILQQSANLEMYKALQENFNMIVTQSSEKLFYEKDDGKCCSYINQDGNFCVADRQQGIMFVFTQDSETNALRAECFKCNKDLRAEGDRLFIAGEWTNHDDTIRFQRTENEAYNLSVLYGFEATTQFLKNHNISEEQIAALQNSIITPNTNKEALTKKGEYRIKSLYKELASIPEVAAVGLNVELQTTAGNYLRFTNKEGKVTQVNFDKNGDITNIEHCSGKDQEFKMIQQVNGNMETLLAKPSKDCEDVMALLKKAQYALATAKSSKPKEKIKLIEQSSPALWEKASSDSILDRIQAVRDRKVGNDILEHLAKDENSYVRQAVAGVINDTEIISLLAKDSAEGVRAEIAKRGLMPNTFVYDKSAVVRAEVAKSGNCLDLLINDPDEAVRAAVATQGYCLAKLLNDQSDVVRTSAREALGLPQELLNKVISEYPAERAEAAYLCKNSPVVMSVLAEDPQKRVRIAVAENGGALEKLVTDRESEVRLAVAKQGYGFELLMNDLYTPIRVEIVKQGYMVEKFASDPVAEIRMYVAQQGYCLNELSHDKDEMVRVAVVQSANRREHSDILQAFVNDPSPAVRIALAERGYGLDTLVYDKDEDVRAAVAKNNEMYAEKLKDDKSEVVRNAAKTTLEPSMPAKNKERD